MQAFRDLWIYVKKYPRPYIIGLIGLVVFAFFTTLTPIIIGKAVDGFRLENIRFSQLMVYVLELLAVTFIATLAMVVVRRTMLNASWAKVAAMPHSK